MHAAIYHCKIRWKCTNIFVCNGFQINSVVWCNDNRQLTVMKKDKAKLRERRFAKFLKGILLFFMREKSDEKSHPPVSDDKKQSTQMPRLKTEDSVPSVPNTGNSVPSTASQQRTAKTSFNLKQELKKRFLSTGQF